MDKVLVPKKPTVLEIARRANVSQAAVSTVLNAAKSSTIGVSQKTRQKILRVAGEVGYVRNELARSLATGKTHTIGILVQSINNNFYAEFFKYLNDVCYNSGYSVFITNSEFDYGRERRNLESFLNRCVDAVIINRTANEHDDLIQMLIDRGIHVIIEGEMGPVGFPLVTIDEFKVAGLAAEYLWSLGHRKILYFSAEKVKDRSQLVHYYRRENFWGPWARISGGQAIQEFSTADPVHGGNDLAEYLTRMPAEARPTAVVCSTDRLALGLMSGLRVHRIRVPEDISVLGCDDIPAAAEAIIPLTTIRLPVEKVAQQIWGLLSRMLGISLTSDTADTGGSAPRILVEPELVVRDSVRSL
jgi:LacI family transcriptional regulator